MSRDLHKDKERVEHELEYIKGIRAITRTSKGKRIEPAYLSIPKIDQELLLGWHTSLAAKGISPARIKNYLAGMRAFTIKVQKSLSQVNRQDIEAYLQAQQARGLKPSMMTQLKLGVKVFYHWFAETQQHEELDRGQYPKIVSWITTKVSHKERNKLPKRISEEDVKKLIEACPKSRDKALIALLYDCGLRIGEAMNLKRADLEPGKDCWHAIVEGKTGQRRIPLLLSIPYLARWLEDSPSKNSNDYVFISLGNRSKHEPLGYPGAYGIVVRAAEAAKVNVHVHPYLFRHERQTQWAASELPFSVHNKLAGWVQDSRMRSVYEHLSDGEVERAWRKSNGLVTDDDKAQEQSKLTPVLCRRCKEMNAPGSEYCQRCGAITDIKKAYLDMDESFGTLFENQEMLNLAVGQWLDKNALPGIVRQVKEKGLDAINAALKRREQGGEKNE